MVMRESQEIKATYRDGVFMPSEPVELENGCEVTVSVNGAESTGMPDRTAAEHGAADESEHVGTRLLAMVEEFKRKYPPQSRESHPPDFVKNKKHYLYGHPKDEA